MLSYEQDGALLSGYDGWEAVPARPMPVEVFSHSTNYDNAHHRVATASRTFDFGMRYRRDRSLSAWHRTPRCAGRTTLTRDFANVAFVRGGSSPLRRRWHFGRVNEPRPTKPSDHIRDAARPARTSAVPQPVPLKWPLVGSAEYAHVTLEPIPKAIRDSSPRRRNRVRTPLATVAVLRRGHGFQRVRDTKENRDALRSMMRAN